IKMATSIIDYVFRVLGYEYLGRTDFVQVKPIHEDVVDEFASGASGDDSEGSQSSVVTDPGVSHAQQTAVSSEPAASEGINGHRGGQPEGSGGNGSHAHSVGTRVAIAQAQSANTAPADGGLSDPLSSMMGDAPFCDICGHITVRNGGCYKCLN